MARPRHALTPGSLSSAAVIVCISSWQEPRVVQPSSQGSGLACSVVASTCMRASARSAAALGRPCGRKPTKPGKSTSSLVFAGTALYRASAPTVKFGSTHTTRCRRAMSAPTAAIPLGPAPTTIVVARLIALVRRRIGDTFTFTRRRESRARTSSREYMQGLPPSPLKQYCIIHVYSSNTCMNISCCSDFAPCSHEKPQWVVPWVVSYDFAWRLIPMGASTRYLC